MNNETYKTYKSLKDFIDAFHSGKVLEIRIRYNASAVGNWELLKPYDDLKFFETLKEFTSIEWRIKVPVYYCKGQVFIDSKHINDYYMLCQVEEYQMALIHLPSGNRQQNPYEVENSTRITEDEMMNICGKDFYKNLMLINYNEIKFV